MSRIRSLFAAAGVVGTAMLMGATVSYYEEALPSTMNPLFARTMVDYRTHELVFDRLFFRSAINNELRSRIVERYEKLDGGQSLKLIFKEGVKWHDGQKFEPDDVCFTIAAMLDTSTASTIAKPFREAISGCEVVKGENAAIIHFRKIYHQPLEQLGFSVIPKHIFQGNTAISPDLDFSSKPIGTGPMKGAKGRREVRFDAYPNTHHVPGISILSMAEAGDSYVAVQTLINGGVQGLISVAPSLRAEVAASDDVALKSYDLRSWWFIAINVNKDPLKKKGVRQALDLALDRAELRELTIGVDPNDENPPCEFVSGPFVQSSPYYNRAIKVTEKADRAKSAELMSAAGLTQSAGKWMSGGTPITLKIGMNSSLDAEAKDLLNQIGNQLQAAGFDRTVYRVTSDDWTKKALTGTLDYDLLIGKWSFGLVEDVNPLFFTRAKDNSKGGQNIFNYSNAEVDAILDRYDNAHTDTEARDAYHELHAYLAQDLPYLFLWKLDTKSAWRNEIRNNTIAPYYYFTEFDGWKYEGGAATPTGG